MEPCVVIASTSECIPPRKIIEGILEVDSLHDPIDVLEGIQAYPWEISTKYYDAKIHLCAVDRKTLGNQEFAESVNAVVLCFDSQSKDGLHSVEQWIPFINEFNPEVKILVCDYCVDVETVHSTNGGNIVGVDRVAAINWCLEQGFEFVELNPREDDSSESDLEDDFVETVGVKRISQALQAHIWPNMIPKSTARYFMKDTNTSSPPSLDQNHDRLDSGVDSKLGEEDSAPSAVDTFDVKEMDAFEALFLNLSTMKSKSASLPASERHDFAEKMALAFWHAMGGEESDNESEIESHSESKGD